MLLLKSQAIAEYNAKIKDILTVQRKYFED